MSALAKVEYKDGASSYDEAAKPFPNADEYFLGTKLGLTVDPVTHIRQLGKLDAETISALRSACIQNMTPKLRHGNGWEVDAEDKRQHPNGDAVMRCAPVWEALGSEVDKSYLRPLIPQEKSLERLDTTHLLCDFVGFHDDVNLTEEKNRGIIAVLLNAPYGCKLITNGSHETVAEVGGVYLMDDLYKHGAFPTEMVPTLDHDRMQDAESEEYRDHVARNIAMSFLLIAQYYDDEY